VSISEAIQFREIELTLIAVVPKICEKIDHGFVRLAAAGIGSE